MFALRDLSIIRVEEMVLPLPIGLLNPAPELIERHRSWLIPDFVNPDASEFWLFFQTWILRLDDLVIVIDPCNGNARNRPVHPQFNGLDTAFLERFEATGVSPEQVDVVFCTHLHCDHCGWNTRLRAGRWVPTFPNARYIMVRREVERWDPRRAGHVPVDYNVGVFEDSIAPIIEAGLAELVDDTHQVRPGVSIIPAYGHTQGHSILRVEAADTRLYCTGDAFHHPLQVTDPALHLGGCDDLAQAIATRDALRRRIAQEDAIMLPAHFPRPHAGRVVEKGEEFQFVAL